MKILFDIRHPAQINFFKHSIKKLSIENEVIVTTIGRGRLPEIVVDAFKKYPHIKIKTIGKHRGNFLSIVVEANILRFFRLFYFLVRNRPHLVVSVAGFLIGFGSRLLGIDNIQFSDDPENNKVTKLASLTANELYVTPNNLNYKSFNSLKEWAYLSPDYFEPQEDILAAFGLEPYAYIFIREVSTGSLNYSDQNSNTILNISRHIPKQIRVVFSLENKKMSSYYPKNWIVLKEPVEDIHSLIYYSRIVISSGDSMAREGALLGVPSIYCGIREMNANNILIRKGRLFKLSPAEVVPFVRKIYQNEIHFSKQDVFRNELLHEWIDVNEFIISKINNFKS